MSYLMTCKSQREYKSRPGSSWWRRGLPSLCPRCWKRHSSKSTWENCHWPIFPWLPLCSKELMIGPPRAEGESRVRISSSSCSVAGIAIQSATSRRSVFMKIMANAKIAPGAVMCVLIDCSSISRDLNGIQRLKKPFERFSLPLFNQSINQINNRTNNQSINQSIDRETEHSCNQSINRWIYYLLGRGKSRNDSIRPLDRHIGLSIAALPS